MSRAPRTGGITVNAMPSPGGRGADPVIARRLLNRGPFNRSRSPNAVHLLSPSDGSAIGSGAVFDWLQPWFRPCSHGPSDRVFLADRRSRGIATSTTRICQLGNSKRCQGNRARSFFLGSQSLMPINIVHRSIVGSAQNGLWPPSIRA